jgi:hypothetical protein
LSADGLLGVAGQLVGSQVERIDGAVLDEVADPVVGSDDHVGPVAGRVRGDEVALEVLGDGLHLDGDAVGLAEGLGDLLDGVDLERVGPDQEVGVTAAVPALGARARGGLGS